MDISLYAEILAIVVVLAYVLAVVSAFEAILNSRTSQGAIAWAISLLTFPLLVVPLYLIFGRNRFDGYLEQRDEIEAESLRLIKRTSGTIDEHVVPLSPDTPMYTSLFNLARLPATTGNRVELLVDGERTFDSILEGLKSAKKYIFFQFYIIRDDDLGRRLGRVLTDKAREGVRVFLLYDEIGSRPFSRSRLLKQLRTTGVQAVPFNTTQGRRNRFQLNFRNHRKTVVVDGREAWIGGHNVGDEYLGRSPKFGRWRDTHMRLEGPAALGAQIAFVEDWRWAADETLSELDWEPSRSENGSAQALVIASGPADDVETASLMYTQAINAATHRIWIASPYFVPDDAIVQSLQLAALRGVDVRILIPEISDSALVKLAAYSYFDEVSATGVSFYRYQDGFLHGKVMLIDDSVAAVGTANFDNRSFRLNFEITSLVADQEFAQAVETMFEDDFANSRRMEPGEYEKKNYLFRVATRIARLASPVL
jgi:cardiolipin synthase